MAPVFCKAKIRCIDQEAGEKFETKLLEIFNRLVLYLIITDRLNCKREAIPGRGLIPTLNFGGSVLGAGC